MIPVLNTLRVFLDEDTRVEETRKLAIPYSMVCGPIEDVSYLWEKHDHVTSFIDEFGEKYHVLEPFAKVLDNWLVALEMEQHKGITFSAQ